MTANLIMPGLMNQKLGAHSKEFLKSFDRNDWRLRHEFECTELVHFTDNEYAVSIGKLGTNEPFCFKANRCWMFNLIWWSPRPPDNWKNDYSAAFGESPAFEGPSLCGPIGLVSSWEYILSQYARSRQSTLQQIEFRVFGTFLYRKEIMFAVLVCIEGDENVNSLPLIPYGSGTEAFVPMPKKFIWKVYSTLGFNIQRQNLDWTWDHLSFGFNCPTSDLNLEPQFCKIIEKEANSFKPLSRFDQCRIRTPENIVASPEIVNFLNCKINGA